MNIKIMLEYRMSNNYSYAFGALLLLTFVLVAVVFYPVFVPVMFLAATLVVATIAMLLSLRAAIVAYLIASSVILYLPLWTILPLDEIFIRFLGFSITAAFLSILSNRIKGF